MTASKKELRQQAYEIRAAMGDPDRTRIAAGISAHMSQVAGFPFAEKNVALYAAVRGEIDIMPLAAKLQAAGAVTALPVPVAGHALTFAVFDAQSVFETGAFDIPVPQDRARTVNPDILLMPCLAFSAAGHRLGYGGGYYDRYLGAFNAADRPLTIGIAPECLRFDMLPVEAHDISLDYIVTEAAVYVPRRP